MAAGSIKAFESLVGGQNGVVRHMDKSDSKPADAEKVAAKDNYQAGSKGKSLEQIQNGGAAGRAQFKAPGLFRS